MIVIADAEWEMILKALEKVYFGEVIITVINGRITVVSATERMQIKKCDQPLDNSSNP